MAMLLNPLGLLNNDPSTPVRVEQVPPGLACNCFCADCGGKFIAVQPNNNRQWHFRHYKRPANCGNSFESAVHLMAKKELLQNKCLMLPDLTVRPSRDLCQPGTRITQKERIVKRQLMNFDHVKEEVGMGERRPDIVMWKGDRKLLVEIVVANDLTEEKVQWIRQNDYATVRVDLSWVGYDVNPTLLLQCLRTGHTINVYPEFNIVSWIHNPLIASAQSRVNKEYLQSIQASSVVQPELEPEECPTRTQQHFQF
jgi:hypothetical protein